uniref:MFS transporter n=1 Tax=unclassified Microbacterium TaxID=2609290 RepID=UPI00097E7820|nr:MFS transporter [Microbacterium sp. JB110]RCS62138.1 MFS transporter [Microbacterium sp. JB110]SJM53538.1 Probable transporter [Frigoribacterium sp. JB110]
MIYGPTALYSFGQGAVLPLLPIIAVDLGASLAVAALAPAGIVVGQLCGNIPAGWLVSRVGERRTMMLAALGSILGCVVMLLAPVWSVLALGALTVGFFAAAFALARHTFMTTRVPIRFRARALATLGGAFRLGAFSGPFVAAGLLALFGAEQSSIWFFAIVLVFVGLLVTFGPDPESRLSPGRNGTRRASREVEDTGEPVTGSITVPERTGVWRTMWRYRAVLSRLGAAAACLAAVRAARQSVLPLWGVSIGLDSQTIALVVGVAGALDFALFYVSGHVTDRFGRLWAVVPSSLLMGAALVCLSLTHDLDSAALWFGVFAIVVGVGNGLSSGILLTLGADVAPAEDPAAFLGSWRTLSDAGGASTPLIVSGITAVASLSFATAIVGAIGLLGAFAFVRWVPRYAPGDRGPGADGASP